MQLIKRITDRDFHGGTPIYLQEISRRAARGVIFDERHQIAMMFMTEMNLYKLPGGGIEEGESADQAFLREVQEETGCKVEIIEQLGYIEEHKNQNYYLQHSSCFLAKVTSKSGRVYLTENEKELGMQVVWMDVEKAINVMNRSFHECDDYSTKFMLLRDWTILEVAKERLNVHI